MFVSKPTDVLIERRFSYMTMLIHPCPLCGRSLDADVSLGECAHCNDLTLQFINNGIFKLPDELKPFISAPEWLLPQHRMRLAVIRCGTIAEHGSNRSDVEIAIGVAKESGCEEEEAYIKELVRIYKQRHKTQMKDIQNALAELNKLREKLTSRT